MTPPGDNIDFFIVPVSFFSTERQSWYLYNGWTSHCLSVHDDLADATRSAIEMAQYWAARGHSVQVHVKQADQRSWKTVWQSADDPARFP